VNIQFEIIPDDRIECCRELCNELMSYQKSKAIVKPELFDGMNFETRLFSSVTKATHNRTVVAKADDNIVGYVYTNVSPKEVYSNEFATFFDLNSVQASHVGCLSQFYLRKQFRQYGIGTKLFRMSMDWLGQFKNVEDYFIFVSNGNDHALEFYKRKGFTYSHDLLDGFITVLRSSRHAVAGELL